MISFQSFALLAALSAPGQPLLLDFHADWCGPCRTMDPVIRRLIAEGYPVRKVNIDREQQITRKYRVRGVPTFVMTVDGQELSRVTGATSYSQLAGMFRNAQPADTAMRGSPAPARRVTEGLPLPRRSDAPTFAANERHATPAVHVPTPPPTPTIDPRTRAMHATVRLRIEDPKGNSFGTGTIIDTHGDEALVVTCGHIFRDSEGRGKISVDLFAPGAQRPVPGQLIAYSLKEDVALVAVRPGIRITPVPVPPRTYQVRRGDRTFSIGCDHGNDPTVHETHVTGIDKYVMPANIVAAGEPAIGRSGGGLFSADGKLVGVCNLASPTDREGIYAALSLVHDNLDKSGLAAVYERNSPQLASTQKTPPAPATDRRPPHQPPAMPKTMPRSPLDDRRMEPVHLSAVATHEPRMTDAGGQRSNDTEIICIVRSKSNPQARPEVIFLDQPPRDLLNRLATESRSPRTVEPVVLEASASNASIATRPARNSFSERPGSPVIRAQSGN